jgi:hypothetical protein
MSHIIAVLSVDPVTTYLLSWLIAKQSIRSVWAYKVEIFYPEFVFQIIAVMSLDPVIIILLSLVMAKQLIL